LRDGRTIIIGFYPSTHRRRYAAKFLAECHVAVEQAIRGWLDGAGGRGKVARLNMKICCIKSTQKLRAVIDIEMAATGERGIRLVQSGMGFVKTRPDRQLHIDAVHFP